MTSESEGYDLARLIDPISTGAFQTRYWEKQPLVIQRDDPFYYKDLFSLDGFDAIVSTCNLLHSDIGIVRDGRETPLRTLIDGHPALALEKAFACYRDGSTIVLQLIHERWKPLMGLCRSLSKEVSAGFQVNAYLTPPNARGFGLHYDTHDVFVLQIQGAKHWRIFNSPLILPLPSQKYQANQHNSLDIIEEFDLNSGGVVYIPRGFIHEADSCSSTSLHLTLGVLPITWAETILTALESIIERDSRFRESLPPGFARIESISSGAETQARELINVLLADLSAKALLADAAERAALLQYPELDGHLLDLEIASTANLSTSVRRRPGVQWRIKRTDDEVRLNFFGKELRMPGRIEPLLLFIGQTTDPFTGASLPRGFAEEERLVLIRRLLREGFLTRVALD
jgi:hypothetical protein